jgi:membrane protein required for colicin V production
MNWLDAIIIVILIYGAWKGWKRGLIFEVAMIVGLIIAFYAAFKFSDFVTKLLNEHFESMQKVSPYISCVLIFSIIVLSFILLAKLLEGILKLTALNLFNTIGGAVFGIIKFGLVLSVLFWLMRSVEPDLKIIPEKVRETSFFYQPVLKVASAVQPLLQDVKKEFKNNIGQ